MILVLQKFVYLVKFYTSFYTKRALSKNISYIFIDEGVGGGAIMCNVEAPKSISPGSY